MLTIIPCVENRSVCQGGLPDIRGETASGIFVPFCEPKACAGLSRKHKQKSDRVFICRIEWERRKLPNLTMILLKAR